MAEEKQQLKTLLTRRMELRSFCMEDLDDFHALCSQKEVMIPAGFSVTTSMEESRETLEQYSKCSTMWAVCRQDNGKLIGLAYLDGDPLRSLSMNEARMIGYLLSKDCWGQGLATELSEEILRYGFEELGLLVISAGYLPNNPASGRVLQKLGFTEEIFMRGAYESSDGTDNDTIDCSMTREEYFQRKGQEEKKTLSTNRLVLRAFTMEDLSDFYEYCKDPDTGIHAGWKPHESIEESRDILHHFIEEREVWAICEKQSGKVIGSIGLHRDSKRRRNFNQCRMMGYVLSKAYWGQGLMTEAAKEVLRHAFEDLGLEMVTISHFSYNQRSARVIQKLGFHREGVLRKAFLRYDGSLLDDVGYSMTREEYQNLYCGETR